MKKLSDRLEILLSYIEKGDVIADIGSDHCLIPIKAFAQNKIDYAFAVENKIGPYTRMKKAILATPYSIEPSLSDGIEKIPNKINTLLLAGMGGPLICKILSKDKVKLNNIRKIIIDAHTQKELIISFLEEIGYHLEKSDFLIEKGIAYETGLWIKGETNPRYTNLEKKYGPLLIKEKNKKYFSYLMKEIKEKEAILSLIPPSDPKRNKISEDIKEMRGIINEN